MACVALLTEFEFRFPTINEIINSQVKRTRINFVNKDKHSFQGERFGLILGFPSFKKAMLSLVQSSLKNTSNTLRPVDEKFIANKTIYPFPT